MKCSHFYLFTIVNKYRIQMKITRYVFVFNDPVFQALMALHMSDSLRWPFLISMLVPKFAFLRIWTLLKTRRLLFGYPSQCGTLEKLPLVIRNRHRTRRVFLKLSFFAKFDQKPIFRKTLMHAQSRPCITSPCTREY